MRSGWPRYYTVLLLLFAAVFISYIDRTNISVAAIAMKVRVGQEAFGLSVRRASAAARTGAGVR